MHKGDKLALFFPGKLRFLWNSPDSIEPLAEANVDTVGTATLVAMREFSPTPKPCRRLINGNQRLDIHFTAFHLVMGAKPKRLVDMFARSSWSVITIFHAC